jgi:hypothetical protein
MTSKTVFAAAAVLLSLLLVSMGSAEDALSVRERSWPIRDGHNLQPTERELRALNQQDVTPDQAREIDRLYNQLLAEDEKARKRYPAQNIEHYGGER